MPCVEIEDAPRFVWRGLLLDVARHYMPVEFVKKFIDLAALHKFNMLQLHLTDDQGWRIEIRTLSASDRDRFGARRVADEGRPRPRRRHAVRAVLLHAGADS